MAETAQTRAITEYHGRPVGNGVIVLQEGADDCVISGLTVYNNYGTAVENTTIHQMAIFDVPLVPSSSTVMYGPMETMPFPCGRPEAMVCIIMPISIFVVRVWIFFCPRGWCYATRCYFYGDSRAMIWHDGRGDKNKKLVITNSSFDAKTPTLLGRYHHDSQFYLIKCKMSKNVLDGNIHYAYSDKVLDPCPWGLRTYYYGCTREGGHSGWLNDNLKGGGECSESFMALPPSGHSMANGTPNNVSEIFGMCWPTNLTVCNMKMPPCFMLYCFFVCVNVIFAVARQQEKPRVIVTTDGEIDDQSSMIRFLMYSSDYDVAGIVQVNGVQKDGHSKDKWIESQIAKYAECLPNLRKHNPDYPDAEYLLSVLAVGNENREDLHKLPPFTV